MMRSPALELIGDGRDQGLAMPLFHRSGRTDKGPKKPTLPQFVAKFIPASAPSCSAAKEAICSAPKRPYT